MEDVVIVGAGPTGLTLAAELVRRGRSFRLLESALAPSSRSKATVVSSRTLEVLDALGIADRALALGRQVQGLWLWSEGTRLTELTADRGTATRFPFPLVLPQSDTERLLLDRLAEDGVHPEGGRRVTAVGQDGDRVLATVEGPDGREEIAGRWLVGCDGVRSVVRSAVGVDFPGRRLEQTFLAAEVRAEVDLPADRGHFFLSDRGVVVLVALPVPSPDESLHRLTIDLPESFPDEPDVGLLQSELDRRGAGAVRLRSLDWVSSYRIASRIAVRFRSGRVLLAGDAAHVHSPVGGQGMNTGIQDAVNLGWKLDLVAGGRADPGLLGSYEAERLPVARAVVRETELVSRMGLLRAPAAVRARTIALRGAARAGLTRRAARRLTQLEVGYPRSPVVDRRIAELPGNRLLRPGRRAPDGTLHTGEGSEVRLHQLFARGGHTLLVFAEVPFTTGRGTAGPGVAVQRVCRGPCPDREDGALVDDDGAVHRAYGVRGAATLLVRPDGYVAAAATGADPATQQRVLSWVPGGAGHR